jgi:hypothetical protein
MRHKVKRVHFVGIGGAGMSGIAEVPLARLMHDDRPQLGWHCDERRGNCVVQRRRAEASADDEHAQRAASTFEALRRRRHRDDVVAQRIAHPCRTLACAARQRAGEPQQYAVGAVREDAVREPGHRIGVVHDQRLAGCHTHERSGERCEATETQHDVRTPPPDHAQAVDARGEQREGAEDERAQSLSAHAAKRDALEFDAVLRHQARFHPFARAEPEHAASARHELRRNREAREYVASRSAGRDHHRRTHTENPRSNWRFS